MNIDTASSLLFTTVRKNQSFFLEKVYRMLRKKNPKSASLRFLDIITETLRYIGSSLQLAGRQLLMIGITPEMLSRRNEFGKLQGLN